MTVKELHAFCTINICQVHIYWKTCNLSKSLTHFCLFIVSLQKRYLELFIYFFFTFKFEVGFELHMLRENIQLTCMQLFQLFFFFFCNMQFLAVLYVRKHILFCAPRLHGCQMLIQHRKNLQSFSQYESGIKYYSIFFKCINN